MDNNKRELINVIHRMDSEQLTPSIAAKISGYSEVHIRNMYKKYKIFGDSAFIHGNTGRQPKTKVAYEIKRRVVKIYKEECSSLNFSVFTDVLESDYLIKLQPRTVYNILTEAGITSPEKRKSTPEGSIHRPRARREHPGELLQLDATPYDWFSDGNTFALHGSIDDATGTFTGLYMCENECLYGYMELVRQTFYAPGGGHPQAVYTDAAGIFCYTPRNKENLTIEEQLAGMHEKRTQWQRMLDEVHVEQIIALSPQAKGRIERAWRTVQGILPWKLQHAHIHDIETANIYIHDIFMPWFNNKYGVEPKNPIPVYHKAHIDPDYVLCARTPRRTSSAGIFSFEGYKWQACRPKRSGSIDFELCVSEHGIKGYKDGEFFEVRLLEEIQEVQGDNIPQVLKSIIYKYMYKDGHPKV